MIVNGLKYHVEVGSAGRPLLLLHGFMGSADDWLPFQYEWMQDHLTIAPDLPGHGRTATPTDPARTYIDAVAADLLAICDEYAPDRPVDLLGYSMGGRVALAFALSNPQRVRSLMLESASPGLHSEEERATRRADDEARAQLLEREGVEAFVNAWEALPLWTSQARLPQATRDALRRDRLRNTPTGLAASLRGLGTGSQPSYWERLKELQMPVLLIAGALDEKYAALAQKMAAQISQAQLALIEQAGHNVHLEAPQAFSDAIADFLWGVG